MPDSESERYTDTEYPMTSTVAEGQTLVEHYNAHYGHYIGLVDQLRTFGLEKEIPLPQVVVTGIQSSGKSSVLDSISGVPLPRGTGRGLGDHVAFLAYVVTGVSSSIFLGGTLGEQ